MGFLLAAHALILSNPNDANWRLFDESLLESPKDEKDKQKGRSTMIIFTKMLIVAGDYRKASNNSTKHFNKMPNHAVNTPLKMKNKGKEEHVLYSLRPIRG